MRVKVALTKKLLIPILMVLFLIAVPGVAFANYLVGGYVNFIGTSIGGSDSYIGTAKYPVVYSDFSTAWTNVQDSSSDYKYIQVGWMYRYGLLKNNINYFFEYNANGVAGNFTRIFSGVGPAEDSSHDYQVKLTSGTWYGTVGGAQIGSVPNSNISWTPDQTSYAGEVVDVNKQAYPGQSSDRVKFSNNRYFNNSTQSWSTPPSLTEKSSPTAGLNWVNTNTFEIWDTRY